MRNNIKQFGTGMFLPNDDSLFDKVKFKVIKRTYSEHTEEFDDFTDEIIKHDYFKQFRTVGFEDSNYALYNLLRKNKCELITGAIFKIHDPLIGNITLYSNNDGTVELYRLEIYKRRNGYGTEILNIFNQISCDIDVVISLKVGSPDGSDFKISNNQRIMFYKKNGFNVVKGIKMNNMDLVNNYYKSVA